VAEVAKNEHSFDARFTPGVQRYFTRTPLLFYEEGSHLKQQTLSVIISNAK
jgi:hypothetical protein